MQELLGGESKEEGRAKGFMFLVKLVMKTEQPLWGGGIIVCYNVPLQLHYENSKRFLQL